MKKYLKKLWRKIFPKWEHRIMIGTSEELIDEVRKGSILESYRPLDSDHYLYRGRLKKKVS